MLIISCEKIEPTNTPISQEIYFVKKEEEIKKSINWLSKNSFLTKSNAKWMPMWEKGLIFHNDTSKTLEVPLSYLFQDIISTKLFIHKPSNQEILSLVNKESLVIESNNQGIYRAFFMIVVPSEKFVRNSGNSLAKMTYLFRDRKFDGLVLYKNLEGQYVGGWKYEEGKIISKLRVSSHNVPTKNSVTYCQSTYHISWIEWTYNNSPAMDISNIEVNEEINCWTVDYPYSGGGGGGSGSEGGGYVDSNDNQSPDDKIKFDEESLSVKDKIEELYATCAGNSIVSNISGNIYINHNPNQTYSLSYAYSSNNGHIISWKTNTPNANDLIHELVHALQKEQNLMLSNNLNTEIEAFMAYYIFSMNKGLMLPGDIEWILFDYYLEDPTSENYLALADAVRGYSETYSNYTENILNRSFDRIRDIFQACYSIQIANPL